MGNGGPGGPRGPRGPRGLRGPRRSSDSSLGLTDLRSVTQSVSNAYAVPTQGHQQTQQSPQPPPHHLSRGRPSLAAAAIASRTQYYRAPKDIGYHEITPNPSTGPAALYILMLEPSVATGGRRCTTFLTLDYPFQDNCRNTHFSCNEENREWRVRVEERRRGTPRTETSSLLTLDFVAFIDPFRRDHLQNILMQPPQPAANNNAYFNSQAWSHTCLAQLQQLNIISQGEFIGAQRNMLTSMAIPFFSFTPNSL